MLGGGVAAPCAAGRAAVFLRNNPLSSRSLSSANNVGFSQRTGLVLFQGLKKLRSDVRRRQLPVLVCADKSAKQQGRPHVERQVGIPVLDKDANGNFFLNSVDSSSPPLGSVNLKFPAQRAIGIKKVAHSLPRYPKAARRFYNEKFRSEPERLSKVLAAAGVASRRASEDIIFAGRVKVNGKVCTVPQTPVDPLKDVIFLDGGSLPKKMAPKFYFALNKPKGYICSSAEEGSKPVLSLFDSFWKIWAQRNVGMRRPRLFTVGRLDVATSGLLLVTNDGDFAQKVSHPSSGLTKEYVATVSEKVTKRQLQLIGQGAVVQGVHCVPTRVELLEADPADPRQRLRIVVSEGRNHEVRHLVTNAGLEVQSLKRVRIGGIRLSRKLGAGKYEVLTEAQVNKVLDKQVQDTA